MTGFRIPLACPDIGAEEKRLVAQVLDSGKLSRGPMVQAFEQAFAQKLECRHAVAVSSGSAALHLALVALGVEPGREVITSPFTVPATANMILAAGARVRFCDIQPDTLGLDPDAAASAICDRTGALMPVHAFGIAAPMKPLLALARRHGLPVIEDACEALGNRLDGKPLGSLGDCGCFGFYPNKQLVTGEGGMLITNHDDVAETARQLRNHGRTMDGSWLDQQRTGFNYRLAELPAALGLAQVRRLEEIVDRRQWLGDCYRRHLAGIAGVREVFGVNAHCACRFAQVVVLNRPGQRDTVIQELARQGIQAGRYFAPLHLQPAWRAQGWLAGQFPVTERIAETTLALPFHTRMDESQVETVCLALAAALN